MSDIEKISDVEKNDHSVMTEREAAMMNAANLAYLGDCVYELLVREYLVCHGSLRPSVDSLAYVTAHVQSCIVEKLMPHLTESENDIYRRGRNSCHSTNIPKSSTALEYRRATGLEALFGWLHLTGKSARLRELFDIAFTETETEVEAETESPD